MNNLVERRTVDREEINQFYSVEFSIGDMAFLYQFKIWNLSSKGVGVLVKEGSALLKHLKVGDVIKMKYYREGETKPTDFFDTEICHITKDDDGRFKGHFFVGIAILGKHSSNE